MLTFVNNKTNVGKSYAAQGGAAVGGEAFIANLNGRFRDSDLMRDNI